MLYLAIDQHSKQLTVNLRNEAGEVLLRRQVSTRRDEWYDAIQWESNRTDHVHSGVNRWDSAEKSRSEKASAKGIGESSRKW